MNERWKPMKGETYWVVGRDATVHKFKWSSDGYDSDNYDIGNCFKTKEEAQAAAEKVKTLLLSLHDNDTAASFSIPDTVPKIEVDDRGVVLDLKPLPDTLPKLTAEVFNRQDCPEDAKIAIVNQDGSACFGSFATAKPAYGFWYGKGDGKWFILLGKWDASDWQTSLVERPVTETKLPEWCKVGEWCYYLDDDWNGKYFKITKIKDNYIYGEDWDIDYHHIKQARLRPYNAEEMRGLVGTLIRKGPSLHIITGYENVIDDECMVHVNGCLYNANDLLRQFAIDNEPCGVLEHLNEKGEWVK